MGVIKDNPLVKGATGMIGDTFYFRKVHGQLQMVNRPKRRTTQTKKEGENRNRFKRAVDWANKQMANPDIKEVYEKGITNNKRSAYQVALSDHLNPPKVIYIKTKSYTGAIGDTITIKATDDFKVVRVEVKIRDANGQPIESGDAERYNNRPFIWKYFATVLNKKIQGTIISVTAFDLPGHKGEGEVMVEGGKKGRKAKAH